MHASLQVPALLDGLIRGPALQVQELYSLIHGILVDDFHVVALGLA
jgi:hypothetical protein